MQLTYYFHIVFHIAVIFYLYTLMDNEVGTKTVCGFIKYCSQWTGNEDHSCYSLLGEADFAQFQFSLSSSSFPSLNLQSLAKVSVPL